MKMSQNIAFLENGIIHICYEDRKFKATNAWIKEVLELFWNHQSIHKLFIVRRTESGKVLNKVCVLDKAEFRKLGESLIARVNE